MRREKKSNHMTHRKGDFARSFPVKVVALSFLTIILCGLVLYTCYSFREFDTAGTEEHRIIELGGIIKHLDEVLTMSARMAAATGNLQWEQRYRDFEPQLDAAIKEAISISPELSMSQAANKVDIANVKLVAMENQAFDLIRRGDSEAAAKILYSAEYEEQKRIYSDGIIEFTDIMRTDIKHKVDKSGVVFFGVAIAAIIAIALVLFGWGTVLQMRKRITETKRAQQILQQQLRRDELILQTSVDGFCIICIDGKIIDVNPAYCKISGYSKDELIRMKLSDLEAHESQEDIAQHIEKIMKAGHGRFETKHRRKDGTLVDIEVSTQFCDFDSDKFFFSFFRDITESKKVEDELKKASFYIDAMGDALIVLDMERNVVEFNATAVNMFGYSRKEALRLTFEKLFPEREHPKHYEKMKEVIEGTKLKLFEVLGLTKNGKEIPLLVSGSILKNIAGENVGFVGVCKDITERKQAEEALEHERNLLRTLMNNLPDYIYIKDTQSRFVMCNTASLHLKGATTLDEVAGKTDFDFYPRELAEQYYSLERDIIRSGKPLINREELVVDSAGNSRWLLTTKVPIRDSSGKIMGIVGIGHDITQSKQAAEALRESEEKLKLILERSFDGISISELTPKTHERRLVLCNDRYVEMSGRSREELMAVDDLDTIVSYPVSQKVRQQWRKFIDEGKSFSGQASWIRPDGKENYYEWTAAPVRKGQQVYIIGIDRDITEQKKIQTELEQYREKVLKTQRYAYVDSMGTIVAHQLNQPLTMINMLLGKAVEQVKDEPIRSTVLKNLEESIVEAKKAASIITKFRQYSKEPSLDVTGVVVLADTANKIVSMLSERAKQAQLTISVKGLNDLSEVDISQAALEQIFFNIIQNAIEAADSKKRRKLDITGKTIDGEIELQFSDTCGGIATEHLEKIFEPFFTTKSSGQGMGLGLEIVQQLLLRCGGAVRAQSQPGKGTTFYVTLPVKNTGEL